MFIDEQVQVCLHFYSTNATIPYGFLIKYAYGSIIDYHNMVSDIINEKCNIKSDACWSVL